MMKIDAVNEVLDRLVAERGENTFTTNTGCYYREFDSGAPMCIVGHVLAELEPEYFQSIPAEKSGTNGTNFDVITYRGDVELDDDSRRLLIDAQYYQDNGRSWAESVAEARKQLEDRKARLGH